MLLGFLFHSQHCCLANVPQIYNFFLNVRVKSGFFVCFSASSLACEGGVIVVVFMVMGYGWIECIIVSGRTYNCFYGKNFHFFICLYLFMLRISSSVGYYNNAPGTFGQCQGTWRVLVVNSPPDNPEWAQCLHLRFSCHNAMLCCEFHNVGFVSFPCLIKSILPCLIMVVVKVPIIFHIFLSHISY